MSIWKTREEDESKISDEELLLRICHGDRDALPSLFRRHAHVVRSVAYKVLRDPFEADDLLQEIFLLVHNKCAAFDSSKGPARFWILQMTYHRAINRRRYLSSRHFYTRVEIEDVEPQLPDPRSSVAGLEEAIDRALGRSDLQKLMLDLSENQQRTLRLFFFEGYTFDEIATELRQNRDTVKHYYFRALNKLRKRIFRKGYTG